MINEVITVEQVRKNLQKIVGEPITKVWFGHDTYIFLELGKLHLEYRTKEKDGTGSGNSLVGDWTLGQAPYWKIIKTVGKKKVILDSLLSDWGELKEAVYGFEEKKIIAVELADTMKTLDVHLSDATTIQFYQEKHDFFALSYNHKTYLVVGEDALAHYEYNEL